MLSLALLLGCASHTFTEPQGLPPLEASVELAPLRVDPPPPTSELTLCLESGGSLVVLDAIDNDDTREHGEVVAFGVSPEGRLAVATADANIKLWTLEGFVDELSPAVFTYGPEVAAPLSVDLAFLDEQVLSADRGGLVSRQSEFGFEVVGGTTPETSMTAVAVARDGRVAHADEGSFGNVMIRDLATSEVRGPLDVRSIVVRDLAFGDDGALFVVGLGEGSLLERWGADEREASALLGSVVEEIDSARDVVVAASADALDVFDAALVPRLTITSVGHGGRSVALTEDGRVAFTVGDEGALRAWSTVDGRELGQLAIEDPLRVRAALDLAFVASRDGMLHAIGCE